MHNNARSLILTPSIGYLLAILVSVLFFGSFYSFSAQAGCSIAPEGFHAVVSRDVRVHGSDLQTTLPEGMKYAALFGGEKRNFICYVQLETSMGDIVLELYYKRAPQTVDNFLRYVNSGAYDDAIFHKIDGAVIQGGGFTPGLRPIAADPPIPNEAANTGLKNVTYAVAMARASGPHSATNQFFINTKDNPEFDYAQPTETGWGYCVFGRVVWGEEVVEAIRKVPVTREAGHDFVPVTPVIIKRAYEVTARVHGV